MNQPSPKCMLIAIKPKLINEAGHFASYSKTLHKAALLNGWDYAAAIPLNCKINPIPSSWHAVLATNYCAKKRSLLNKLRYKFSYTRSLFNFLSSYISYDRKSIIFLEFFSRHHLRSFIYALIFLPRKNISTVLLYREHPNSYRNPDDALFFKRCHAILSFILPKDHVHLATDCDLLQKPLQQFFNMPFSLFPIIEPPPAQQKAATNFKKELVCWFAGRPGLEKGSNTFEKIISSCEKYAFPIHLVASKEFNIPENHHSHSVKIIPTPEVLSPEAYLQQFSSADVLLLPYSSKHYKLKTSGVFTEAIAMGKFVLVTHGTWMAHELHKFDLDELITTWDEDEIAKKLLSLRNASDLRKKLSLMEEQYKRTHSAPALARTLQNLITQ